MKKFVSLLAVLALFAGLAEATEYRKHRVNIKALSTTKFELTDVNHLNPHTRDFTGKDFIVVSAREPGLRWTNVCSRQRWYNLVACYHFIRCRWRKVGEEKWKSYTRRWT